MHFLLVRLKFVPIHSRAADHLLYASILSVFSGKQQVHGIHINLVLSILQLTSPWHGVMMEIQNKLPTANLSD